MGSQRAPAEAAGHAFEHVPDHETAIGDGDAVKRHLVPAIAHLGDVHRTAYLGSLFDVPQVDDVVEQEHEPVQRADGKPVGTGFARDEQGTACRPHEPDETAHVGGETFRFAGGEGQFGQAVDDNPADRMLTELGAHGSGQDVEVQIAHRDVGDRDVLCSTGCFKVPAEGGGLLDELILGVLERDIKAARPHLYPLGEPAQPEDRLADARGPGDQGGVTLLRPAAHQRIEAGDPAGDLAGRGRDRMRDECLYAREHLDAFRADPEGVLARPVGSAAHLRNPQPPPVNRLASLVLKLDDAISQGEFDATAQFLRRVLADQQQHRAGLRDAAGQVVQRGAQLAFVGEIAKHLRAVDHDDSGLLIQRLPDDLRHQGLQPVPPSRLQEVTQVDVLDLRAQGLRIEEGELLQVPDELGMRLGHRRVVDALVLGGAGGEAHLLGQDRLARARRARQHHPAPARR